MLKPSWFTWLILHLKAPRKHGIDTHDNSFRIRVIVVISCPISKLDIEAFVIAPIIVQPKAIQYATKRHPRSPNVTQRQHIIRN